MSEHTWGVKRLPEWRKGKGMGDAIKGEEEEMQSEPRRECNGVDQTREGKRTVGLRKSVRARVWDDSCRVWMGQRRDQEEAPMATNNLIVMGAIQF